MSAFKAGGGGPAGDNLKPFGSDWDVIDAACRLLGLYAFRPELVYIGVCLDPLERLTVGEYEPGDWRLEREFLQGSAYTLRFADTEAEAVAALRDVWLACVSGTSGWGTK